MSKRCHTTILQGLAFALVLYASRPALHGQTDRGMATQGRSFLLARGFSPVGNIWITRREARLKRIADSLEALERRHQQAIVKASEALSANEAIRLRLARAEAAERAKKGLPDLPKEEPSAGAEILKKTSTSSPAKLNSQLPDVTGLGEQTPLQQTLVELVNARTAVQLAVLTIRREAVTMETDYTSLKSDREVRAALKQVNSNARLGPARNYQRDLARIDVLAAGAFKNDVPGYFESGQFRVSAIANETQSVTFNFQLKNGPLLLTASAAQRLGLTSKDFAESPREVEIASRRVIASPTRLASLRLGAATIKDVPALVLPPEAEDLGSQLSPAALKGYQMDFQPRRMAILLAPQHAS